MKSKVKLLVVTLVVVAVASVLLYAPLTNALQSSEEQKPDVNCRPWQKARQGWLFLRHSETVEVEGTVLVLFKDMLVVNTTGGPIRVHLPQAWTVDGNQTMREEFLESGYLSVGENITVNALSANIVDQEGLRVYWLLGYEIIYESGVRAYAVLPFNIET